MKPNAKVLLIGTGVVGFFVALAASSRAKAAPAQTTHAPAGTLNMDAILYKQVGGKHPGTRYEIVKVPPFGSQSGSFVSSVKPPIGPILLSVEAYPPDPSAVEVPGPPGADYTYNRTFTVQSAIDREGPTHPTVVQVRALMDGAWTPVAPPAVSGRGRRI